MSECSLHVEDVSLLLLAHSCSLQSFPPPFPGCLSSACFLLSPRGSGHAWVISGFCHDDIETARWFRVVMDFSGRSPWQAESPFACLWLSLQLQPPGAPTLSKSSPATPTGKAQRRMRGGPRLHSTSASWLGFGGKRLGLCWQREAWLLGGSPKQIWPQVLAITGAEV